jgi:hypothetical protein
MALLDELVELIIPADAHSGGARAAGVAGYIDGRLAQYDPAIPILKADRERWKAGPGHRRRAGPRDLGKTFLETSPAERTALLERIAKPLTEAEVSDGGAGERRQPASENRRRSASASSWS